MLGAEEYRATSGKVHRRRAQGTGVTTARDANCWRSPADGWSSAAPEGFAAGLLLSKQKGEQISEQASNGASKHA